MSEPDLESMSDEQLVGLLARVASQQSDRVAAQQEAMRGRIAERVASLRKERGLRQEDLAEMVGRSRATIANIEKRHQGTPLDLLISIASALRTTVEALIIDDPERLQ